MFDDNDEDNDHDDGFDLVLDGMADADGDEFREGFRKELCRDFEICLEMIDYLLLPVGLLVD